MTNLELSNALARNAKLVLSFITKRKSRNPRDPLIHRSLYVYLHFNLPNLRHFPYIQAVRKATKHQNKNLSSKSASLIPTESTSAFHSTNIFPSSCHHIPTNGVAPLSAYNPHTTNNSSNRSFEGLRLETSAFLPLTVANLRFQLSCSH